MTKSKKQLGEFEGDEVLGASIEIRNISGGLNKAMDIDPETFHRGDEVTVVARCTVTSVNHPGVKDTDGVKRVHVMKASEVAIIDDALVSEALDEQARRIEEASGIHQLPIRLQTAHDAGEHADGLVDGCPSCDAEAEAKAAEG